MITVVLHLLRLLPFLFGGHRQLALENVALRQQRAVYSGRPTVGECRSPPSPHLQSDSAFRIYGRGSDIPGRADEVG